MKVKIFSWIGKLLLTDSTFTTVRKIALILVALATLVLTVVNPMFALPIAVLHFLEHFITFMASLGIIVEAANQKSGNAKQ